MPTGQKLLDSLAETWDFFFSDVLPTLQAIFYPVQVNEWSLQPWDPGARRPPVPALLQAALVWGWARPWPSQNLLPTHSLEPRTVPSHRPYKALSST